MSEALRVFIGIIAFAVLVAVVWAFQEWRDRRLIRIAAGDEEVERVRASRIAMRIGSFAIWLVTGASGIVSAISFLAICAGLFTGLLGVIDTVLLIGGFAISGLIYLWSDRILGALP